MSTISEIRRANLEIILSTFPSRTVFANLVDISPAYLSQVTSKTRDGDYRRNLGELNARKVEAALGLQIGWLDSPQTHFSNEHESASLPRVRHVPAHRSGVSGIQNALVETAHLLVSADLLDDIACLEILQKWQPLIAKIKKDKNPD